MHASLIYKKENINTKKIIKEYFNSPIFIVRRNG
jgi:hypothetical protein